MYYKDNADDNEYAHPMDLCPVVDLNEQRVIHIDAYPSPPAIPMRPANYHRRLLSKPFRQPAKPLLVVQPEVSHHTERSEVPHRLAGSPAQLDKVICGSL
jgi:primary-amine oxidase